jgi:hypothetical protein
MNCEVILVAPPTKNTDVFYKEDSWIKSRYVVEIYIPDEYMENSKAMETGTTFSILGFLPYSVIQDGKITFSGTLKFPQLISVNVTEKRSDQIRLSKFTDGLTPVTVLLYQSGENIASKYTEANMMNAEIVFNMILGGNIPSTIPYLEVFDLLPNCFALNDLKVPIPSFIVEDLIATLYRSAKNPDNKFARDLGRDPNINPLSYIAMSTRDVTRHISTFAGVSNEVFGVSLLHGIKRSKEGKVEPVSAIEKTIYA